ncbi:MAG: hypothetical protein ACW972_03535 [Promethearchaeota archaeon]|jgi:hypothetical protein
MNEVTKNVRYDGKVVGTVVIPIYESVEELAENETSANILAQFNKGNTVYLQGIERNKHKPATAGKQKRAFIGFNLLSIEEAQSCQGDPDALKSLIESAEVQARIDAYLEAQNPSSSDDTETEG